MLIPLNGKTLKVLEFKYLILNFIPNDQGKDEMSVHLYRAYPAFFCLQRWFVGVYGISTFVSYLIPNFYTNNQFYFKQFSLK